MLPTGPKVSIEIQSKLTARAEAVAVFIPEGSVDVGESAGLLAEDERNAVARLLRAGVSRGRAREVHFDLIESASAGRTRGHAFRRVLVVGLGLVERDGSPGSLEKYTQVVTLNLIGSFNCIRLVAERMQNAPTIGE